MDREIRDLIRQMSSANPFWGAPRIHGALLSLGIEISQATVAKYMVQRRGRPSPSWRSFLRKQAQGIAAMDMSVVACASFRLLYVTVILGHDRRKIMHTAVTEHPTAAWLSRQVTEAFPWDSAPRYLLRDRDTSYGAEFLCWRTRRFHSFAMHRGFDPDNARQDLEITGPTRVQTGRVLPAN